MCSNGNCKPGSFLDMAKVRFNDLTVRLPQVLTMAYTGMVYASQYTRVCIDLALLIDPVRICRLVFLSQ